MSAGTNGARRVATLLRPSTFDSAVCRSCQETLSRRGYSTAAATTETATPSSSTNPDTTTPQATSTALTQKYNINAGIVLSRAPRLTRELTAFEKAFYFYQRRLNDRLALPFTRYFYFKRDTPGDVDWKRKVKERQTPSRDIGKYNAYGEEAWNDELLVGAVESEPEHQINALVKDAEGKGATEIDEGEGKKDEVPRPLPRVTEADLKGDQRSLDRLLDRTLYLLVKVKADKGLKGGQDGFWRFPHVKLQEKETLRLGAERALLQSAGPNMNTWMVGYHPIGHQVYKARRPKQIEPGVELLGEKTFFLKGRIMAGQADLEGNMENIVDFKWLAKDEISKFVLPQYWSSVRDMLAER
ncbi:54S ribosomal protein L17 mitochondrial [Onygenales sp. PD_40]|nr:54S ribosomal protein L17 mitochondrial [Onygenales sp. PD_40]KAK2803127.1 54S ribosomal protein L17 mitochondrial [Onygenales sp. PD_10]